MRHHSLPQTMTPEQLADYIQSNRIETKNHVEKFPLTEEEKRDLAVKSSLASRAILRLENLLKEVSKLIKKGTPWNTDLGTDGDHVPVPITIPPTAGIDVLKSNRQYADDQIEKGYREDVTPIYFVPWPEYEKILAVCIEGKEWSQYSRDMTPQEVKQHGKPILSASTELRDVLENAGIEIEKVDGKTVHMKASKRNKNAIDKQPPLSSDEKEEIEGDEDEDKLNL
jgi:hypothetical protein